MCWHLIIPTATYHCPPVAIGQHSIPLFIILQCHVENTYFLVRGVTSTYKRLHVCARCIPVKCGTADDHMNHVSLRTIIGSEVIVLRTRHSAFSSLPIMCYSMSLYTLWVYTHKRIQYNTIQYNIKQHYPMQSSATQYNTTQFSTHTNTLTNTHAIQYNTEVDFDAMPRWSIALE